MTTVAEDIQAILEKVDPNSQIDLALLKSKLETLQRFEPATFEVLKTVVHNPGITSAESAESLELHSVQLHLKKLRDKHQLIFVEGRPPQKHYFKHMKGVANETEIPETTLAQGKLEKQIAAIMKKVDVSKFTTRQTLFLQAQLREIQRTAPSRFKVLNAIVSNPGFTATELAGSVAKPVDNTRYHLDYLVDKSELVEKQGNHPRRYSFAHRKR